MKRNYKIISISDIHLRTLKEHDAYKDMFTNLLEVLEKEKPHYFIINGDLFHQKLTISNEANLLMGWFLRESAKLVVDKLIINVGNHDFVVGSNRLDTISPIVDMIGDDRIIFFKNSGCYKVDDNNIVFCVWSLFDHDRPPQVKDYKEKNDPNNQNIYVGLYHGIVDGCQTPTGLKFEGEGVSLKDEDVYEVDHFNCGDIHLHEVKRYDNYKGKEKGLYVMNSSTIQQNHGELLDNHGWNKIFYDGGSDEWEHDLIEVPNKYDYHTILLDGYENLGN